MIRRLGLLCLCLMCLGIVPAANAQSDSDDWEIPHIECGAGCRRSEVVDEEGNLYILIRRSEPTDQVMLYVIKRGTSEFVEYDLLQLYTSRALGVHTYLAPFANGKAVVFHYLNYHSDPPLKLLDLQTNTVIPLEVQIPGSVEECNIYSEFRGGSSIYRIGTNRVLFCTLADGISFLNIARLENDTLVLEHSIEAGESVVREGYIPPWRYLTSSLDGKVYVVPYPETLLLKQIAPQYAHWEDRTDYPVLRFDPVTGSWDSFLIETNSERWEGMDITTLWPLFGVDAHGNLYFSYTEWSTTGGRFWDLVKYDPQGQKIWHITDADFGGEFLFRPTLVAEDRFIFDSMDRILRYVVWEEN